MTASNQHSELLRGALLDAEYRTLGRVAADKRRTDALAALDRLLEQLEAHRTFVDHFLRWCETVAAEEDNPIHLLVREAEALNPASEPKEIA